VTAVLQSSRQEGSFVELGVQDPFLSRAFDACSVSDDAGANVSLATGLAAINAGLPLLHGVISATKQVVRAAKFGDHVVGGAFYALRANGANADDPFAFAQIDVFSETIPWYSTREVYSPSADGHFPSGPVLQTLDPWFFAKRPEAWDRTVYIWRIVITVNLALPVIAGLAGFHETLNQQAFNIADKTFPPYTLLFVSPSQRSALVANSTGVHQTRYTFLYRSDTWISERIDPESVPPTWAVVVPREKMFRATTWPTFPTT